MDLHEAFIGFLCDRYDIPGRFLWDSYRHSMIYLFDFYDISWGDYGGFIGFLWDFHCMSLICLWDCYGIAMGFLLNFHSGSLEFLYDFTRLSMGFL